MSARWEFWRYVAWYLFVYLSSWALVWYLRSAGHAQAATVATGLTVVTTVAFFVPLWSLSVRRMRDAGRSPWWAAPILLCLVPFPPESLRFARASQLSADSSAALLQALVDGGLAVLLVIAVFYAASRSTAQAPPPAAVSP